jgi:hypothetical protein
MREGECERATGVERVGGGGGIEGWMDGWMDGGREGAEAGGSEKESYVKQRVK